MTMYLNKGNNIKMGKNKYITTNTKMNQRKSRNRKQKRRNFQLASSETPRKTLYPTERDASLETPWKTLHPKEQGGMKKEADNWRLLG